MLTGCRQYGARLMELARGVVSPEERRSLLAHAELCGACSKALDQQLALSAALESVKCEPLPEMGAIEAHVMAEFDQVHAVRRVLPMTRWVLIAGLAAALMLGLVFVKRPQPPVEVARKSAPVELPVTVAAPEKRAAPRTTAAVKRVKHSAAPVPATEESEPFLPIPFTVPLGPYERTTVMRMDIPVAALIAAGFSVPVSDPGSVVEADVLVSEDGRARAIRPLSISTSW